MAYNKVVYKGETLIDLTDLDVTEEDVASGKKFIKASGEKSIGTLTSSSLDVGDITLYTKYAYNYDDYVNNSSTFGRATTIYYEDGSTSDISKSDHIYLSVQNGRVVSAADIDNSNSLYIGNGCEIYIASTKKITNLDIEFSGGYGS